MTVTPPLLSGYGYRGVRWILAVVFFYAGTVKLMNPRHFAIIIEAYGLIPESWVMPVALILPAFEVLAAAGLLADVRGSLESIAALLILFMAILGYGIHMGLDADCGCFGPEAPEGQAYAGMRPALYRDILMMGGVFFLYYCRYRYAFRPIRFMLLIRNILSPVTGRGSSV